MTISRDGRFLFVSAMLDNRVYQLSTADGKITAHLVAGVYPHDNKISKDGQTPNGTTLCLAGRASDYVALVRAPELTLITTIPAGDAPGWSEVSSDGRK